MSKDIRIRKGLDIKLVGEAEKSTSQLPLASIYAIKPDNFHRITPKLNIREKAEIKAGEALFHSKIDERIQFPAPVSGEVVEIVRGAKRKILEIKILADKTQKQHDFGKKDAGNMSAAEITEHLLSSGCWPFIRQRPYDIIAKPDDSPRDIFVSAYASAPLAPDYEYVLQGKEAELQAAITALGKLTSGKVHVGIPSGVNSVFSGLSGLELHKVKGPHPAGNVSVLISRIAPINKGEKVWVVSPQDMVIIGELLLTGKFNAQRTVALTGSEIANPRYVTTFIGARIKELLGNDLKDVHSRIISGNVLTGTQVDPEGFLGYYDNHITAIPEGDDYEFIGWALPVTKKISPTRALTFSWLNPNKKYDLNTNTNGEPRAFVVTGGYEEVFPFDIYPMQLLKACLYKDLGEMEELGAYEIAPEDFALTEFVCISKQPHQQIIREGLDLMIQEIG
ncbi:MAG: Na(+)-translocating NADH-quinone reductase subunit A [Flavobacteriaceae bacterium]|nr:Na(+)-translocating NADH-quinone reductase subunit A [Flavobacteriaceae bacterium]